MLPFFSTELEGLALFDNLHIEIIFHLGGTKVAVESNEILLDLDDISLSIEGRVSLSHVSLCVKKGEILGIAGLDGSGQTELTEMIAGILPHGTGKILFQGNEISLCSVAQRKTLGIGFIPQDRMRHGLIKHFNIEENLILGHQRDKRFITRRFLQDKRSIKTNANKLVMEYDIRPTDTTLKASTLSGGNQQKIIIARVASSNPCLIVADQPTRGVDVGAIESIHKIFTDHRNKGGAVLMASLELDEILTLCDRIAVMYCGRLIGVMDSKEATRETIGYMMVGKTEEEGK